MDRKQIMGLLGVAMANFPAQQERNLAPTAELWMETLGDLPYVLAKTALLQVLLTARYFPTVAEIREAALEISRPPGLSAADAWGEIRRAIGQFGHGQPGEALGSMSPRTAAVVRAFGWESFCLCDLGDVPTVRAQFMKAYNARQEAEDRADRLPAGLQDQIAWIGKGGEVGRGQGTIPLGRIGG